MPSLALFLKFYKKAAPWNMIPPYTLEQSDETWLGFGGAIMHVWVAWWPPLITLIEWIILQYYSFCDTEESFIPWSHLLWENQLILNGVWRTADGLRQVLFIVKQYSDGGLLTRGRKALEKHSKITMLVVVSPRSWNFLHGMHFVFNRRSDLDWVPLCCDNWCIVTASGEFFLRCL